MKKNLASCGPVESMDRILRSFHSRGLFSGSSLVADGGKVYRWDRALDSERLLSKKTWT